MKAKFFMIISTLCLSLLLMGCATDTRVFASRCGAGCGTCSTCSSCCDDYYNYNSVCGKYSCTDNTDIADYDNGCPGPFQCTR